MNKLTPEQEQRLREEVRKEFPDDEMMQEIHFVRLMHYHFMKDLSPGERCKFYLEKEKELITA